MTTNLTITELIDISTQMRDLEDEIDSFRIAASPNVGYSEITYVNIKT